MQELMYIGDLPAELWLRILSYLAPNDLVMFARSSRTNRTIAADQSLWKRLCRRWFPLFVENLLSLDNVDWQVEFIHQYRRISRPPFGKAGLYWLFLEADVKIFSSTIPRYFSPTDELYSIQHFLYLAQGVNRGDILAAMYPDISKRYGKITASIVCFYNQHAIALLEKSNDKQLDDALRIASYSGNAVIAKFCLLRSDLAKCTAFINQNHLLYYATSSGFLSVVNVLFGVDVNKIIKGPDEMTPLAVACKNNHYGIIKLLVQSGASDVAKEFILSATDGRYKVFKILIGSTAITPERKSSALLCLLSHWLYSSLKDREKIFILLLTGGVNVKCTDKYGRTPLHYAVKIKRSLIKHLIALGATVNVQDRNGITPLHLAAQYAGPQEIEMLLDKDAPINSQNRNGRCALHYAVMGRNVVALRCLLHRGADPRINDSNGVSPLKLAKSLQMPEETRKLLLALFNEHLISYSSNSTMFFRKRNANDITPSSNARTESSLVRDKRACRHQVLFDDPPVSDCRTVKMN